MGTYYRIETYDFSKMETIGGMMSAVFASVALRLKIRPDAPDEEFSEKIASSDDMVAKEIFGLSASLMYGVSYPEEYLTDKKNRICLFTESDYVSKASMIEMLNEAIRTVLPDLEYVCYEFNLPDDVILYKDEHQVVISRETYEKYFPDEPIFFDIDDDDELDFVFDVDDEECVEEAVERIRVMESYLNKATELLNKKKLDSDEKELLLLCLSELDNYYTSEAWKFDFKLDELGKLPDDLKRGVISEDGISNILDRYDEIRGTSSLE